MVSSSGGDKIIDRSPSAKKTQITNYGKLAFDRLRPSEVSALSKANYDNDKVLEWKRVSESRGSAVGHASAVHGVDDDDNDDGGVVGSRIAIGVDDYVGGVIGGDFDARLPDDDVDNKVDDDEAEKEGKDSGKLTPRYGISGTNISEKSIAYTCSTIDDEFNLLKVHRWPQDPHLLKTEQLRQWINLFAVDNTTILNEINMMEKYWMQHRSTARDGADQRTSMDEYIDVAVGTGNNDRSTFQRVAQQNMEKLKDKARTRVRNMMSNARLNSACENKRGSRGIGSLATYRTNATTSYAASSSTIGLSTLSGLAAIGETTLPLCDRIEVAMVEVRTRKARRRRRHLDHENIVENLVARVENRELQLQRLSIFRERFDKEVRHQKTLSRKKTDAQIITGESVVKFYDDVLKEKDHQLDIIQLSNENLRRKYKAICLALREIETDMANKTTKMDFEQMKVWNKSASLVMEEKKAEYKSLQRLLSECLYNKKTLIKQLEEAEEQEVVVTKDVGAMKRLSVQTTKDIGNMNERRITCMTEHLGYEELLWKAEELHPPDTEDYVRLMERCHVGRRDVAAFERKIRIKEMELKNLKKELKVHERRSMSISRQERSLTRSSWD